LGKVKGGGGSPKRTFRPLMRLDLSVGDWDLCRQKSKPVRKVREETGFSGGERSWRTKSAGQQLFPDPRERKKTGKKCGAKARPKGPLVPGKRKTGQTTRGPRTSGAITSVQKPKKVWTRGEPWGLKSWVRGEKKLVVQVLKSRKWGAGKEAE